MSDQVMQDMAYLEEWFYEHEDTHIVPYIESNFYEASFNYEYNYMFKHLFFTKKIIEDAMLSNGEKQKKLLNSLAFGKSKIVLVEGARGAGKTATSLWIVDTLYALKLHKKIYFVKKGERPAGFPPWINVVPEIEDVPNGSIAIIDESAIKYNARNSWTDDNKDFTSRLVILRHKDISVIVITQHNKMVEINVRRLADIKIFKRGANLTHDDEKPDSENALIRKRLSPRDVDEVLVEIPGFNNFFKFKHDLPEWWDDHISKSFKDFNPELETKLTKKQREERDRELREEKFQQQKEIEVAKIKAMKEAGLKPKIKMAKAETGPAPGDYV